VDNTKNIKIQIEDFMLFKYIPTSDEDTAPLTPYSPIESKTVNEYIYYTAEELKKEGVTSEDQLTKYFYQRNTEPSDRMRWEWVPKA
jgi:hypothetical protein